ncbi:MAG: LTA synthase family protein [Pseudomonadota bacterium]
MTGTFLLRWFLLWVGLGLLLRIGMWVYYPEGSVFPGVLAFGPGVLNDAVTFWLAPGLLAIFILVHPKIAKIGFFVVNAVILVIVIAEGFFWLEFESRLDRLVFHYLAYPREVIVFLEDQFFLSLVLVPFLLFVWLVCWLIGYPDPEQAKRAHALGFLVLALVVGTFFQPVGLGGFNHSRVAEQFVSNGYLGVFQDALYDVRLPPWMPEQIETGYPASSGHVGDKREDTQELQEAQERDVDLQALLSSKKHLILVIEESFAGEVWRDPVLRETYLPNFSRLSKQGLSFTNLYATGSRTTRGMEAILNGFPPLPGISTTEREGYKKLPSLARAMSDAGFYSAFLYGGWPGFSNFSNYWRATGFQKIWSREDFDEPFETSWGVSDGALFTRILTEMDRLTVQQSNVFMSTLTVSHHRPYDFPDNVVQWDANARNSAYAMAYADQSLANFIDAAKDKAWYADTIFIVVADHGLHPRGDQLIPFNSYRIPLLILGQGIGGREYASLGSSISIPQTVLDIFDVTSNELFSGRSLLCDCVTPVPMEYGYHVGLLSEQQLDVVSRDGRSVTWYLDDDQVVEQVQEVEDVHQDVLDFFAPALRWYYAR